MNEAIAAAVRRWTKERYGVAANDWEIQDLIERIAAALYPEHCGEMFSPPFYVPALPRIEELDDRRAVAADKPQQ